MPDQTVKDVLSLRVGLVPPDAVIDLRHRVLRQDLPRESAVFEGDLEPDTQHLAAYDAWNMIVGCCTILHRTWQDRPAWQLRGMAVDDQWQGKGVGRLLLGEVEIVVLNSDHAIELWCNARKIAVPFYKSHGWEIASPEFDIPTAGPHYKMTRKLGS